MIGESHLRPLAQLLFGAAFLFVAYTYVGYPLIAAAMAHWRPRRWYRDLNEKFAVSLIMPVHNGEAIIQAKMQHLLALDPAIVKQIIVVSDGSTDNTAALLEEFRDPRLKVLQLTEQVGKAEALNQALLKAHCELVVFVDIRPRMEEGALRSMISNFADREVGCVAGELIVTRGTAHDAAASSMGGAYWKYEQWIRTSEASWNSPVGVYGGFYAVRRRLSRSFPPGLILDDMFQPLTVIRQGYRSVLDRSATVTDTWPATAKRRVSAEGADTGRQFSAGSRRALGAERQQPGAFSACFAQAVPPAGAVRIDVHAAGGVHPCTLVRAVAGDRGRTGGVLVACPAGACRPHSGAAQGSGAGGRSAGTECSRRGRPVPLRVYKRATLEDMVSNAGTG